MNFFDIMNVSASGLTAQRVRMETISSNLANAQTTKTESGEPYRRRDVVFKTVAPDGGMTKSFDEALRGVVVQEVFEDPSDFRRRFEPGHPDAGPLGFVDYPNVEPVTEMVNLVSATRSYEANLTVIESTKSLMLRTLEI